MEDIITTDPRDAMLIMLNERVGELETTIHTLTQAITTLSNQTQLILDGITSSVSEITFSITEILETLPDHEISNTINNTLKDYVEISDIYIHRVPTRHSLVNVFIQTKQPHVVDALRSHLQVKKTLLFRQNLAFLKMERSSLATVQYIQQTTPAHISQHRH